MYIQKSNIIYYHLTEYTNISVITEGNHKDILYIHFYLQRYLEAPFMKLPEYIQRSDYLLICCLFLRNTIISMFFSNPVMFPFGLSIVLYIFFLYIHYILYIRSAFFKIMFSPLLINNRIYFYIHTSNKI